MKIIGCLNMREKDGGQSSVTVGCVYLPVSFFNACTSDYLRTERLFLQRPISPQMASRCFSYFAALLLEIRNIAFFRTVVITLTTAFILFYCCLKAWPQITKICIGRPLSSEDKLYLLMLLVASIVGSTPAILAVVFSEEISSAILDFLP